MKKVTFICGFFLILFYKNYGQEQRLASDSNSTYYRYLQEKATYLNTFCQQQPNSNITKIVEDDTFEESYRKVFSTVVIGSSDIVKNGSALAYSQDKNKNTFSINGSFMSNYLDGIANFGLSLQSKDSNYNYYTKGSWVSDIGFSFGYSCRLNLRNQSAADGICDDLNSLRSQYLMLSWNKYDSIQNNIDALREKIAVIDRMLNDKPSDTVLEDEKIRLETYRTLKQVELDSMRLHPESFIRTENKKFESKNPVFTGYHIFWFTGTATIKNSGLKILNDSIINDVYQKKYKSLVKFAIEASVNAQKSTAHRFWFGQIAMRFNRKSFLDNPIYAERKFKLRFDQLTEEYNVVSQDPETTLYEDPTPYKDLKAPYLTWDFAPAAACFFALKKRVGFNITANFSQAVGGNINYYPDNYSIFAGGIFRLSNEKEFSSITFMLNAGWDNVLYDENAFDKFSLKATAAIPFTIFDKNSK